MEQKFTFKKLLSLLVVCAMLLSSFTFLAFAEEATNVALGKEYTAPESLGGYNASLTDGVKDTAMAYSGDTWFAFKSHPTDGSGNLGGERTGSVVIDLDGSFDLTEVKIHTIANDGSGITPCSAANVYLSDDGENWGEAIALPVTAATDVETNVAYYIEGTVEGTASYVKVDLTLGEKTFLFFNEIEVYGTEADEAPDAPVVTEQHDIAVSHVNTYTWGVYNAMVIVGEGQNSTTKLGYDCLYWIAIKVDNVDGAYTVVDIEANGEAKANTASADGFILYVFGNDEASYAAAGLVEEGDVLLACDFDWTISTSSETPIGTMSFAPAAGSDAPDAPVGSSINVDGDLSDWEDNWTLVDGETGYWQSVPTDEDQLAGSYNFQITSDETNIYVAAEISGLDCTAFRVWFRTNPEATVYTHFYHIDATGAAGKANTSTTINSAAAIENSAAVGVFAAGEESIIVEFSVPLAEIGATGGDVEYYANTQNGSTLFYPPVVDGEGGSRTANLPYNNWYVAPEEDPGEDPGEDPAEPFNIPVGSINAYGWGNDGYPVILAYGEGANVASTVGGAWFEWWFKVKAEWNETEGAFIVNDTVPSGSKAYEEWTFTANEIVMLVYSGTETYADAKNIIANLAIGDKLYASGFDFTNASANNLIVDGESPVNFSNVEFEEEPAPAPTTSQVVNRFNPESYADGTEGSNSAFIFTDADVYAAASFAWWRHVAFAPIEGEDGLYQVVAVSSGAGGTGGGLEMPEGGFIWVAYEWPEEGTSGAYAIALLNTIDVGAYVQFTGVDFENCTTAEDATAVKSDYVDPNAPVNIALGKNYELSGCGNRTSYYGSLTDGSAVMNLNGDNNVNWFGFYNNGTDASVINAPNGVGYAIIDLEAVYTVNGVKVGIIGQPGWGIANPGGIKAYASLDGESFEEIGTFEFELETAGVGEWTEITADCTARYIKVEFTLAGTFAFTNEIEVYGEEAAEPAPELPGLPENITIWGSGAGVEVMTDGYTGVDEINTWEGNTDKLYGFSNSVLDATEYSFDLVIEETTFDAVTLYVLDFVNGGVTLPDAVSFVINDVWYEATINGNENNIGTIVVELDEAVTASTITVVVSMGVSPHSFAIFNMFTEIEVNEYIPVTSNVVTDWNPENYKSSFGGATGAFIYDDADIYAASGNDWWIHVAFAPVADKDGYYEVVAVRAPTTGNYLAMPENGFIWMAWSSAGGTPDSAGAYALEFMSNLKVGDIVIFDGVDFANHTTEADATATVWVDPDAPVNVALGKDYELSGSEDGTYNANLTDGNAYAGMSYDNKWFVFNQANSPDGIGYAIIDLGGLYDISKVAVNLINETTSGVAKPEYVKFYVSEDSEAWTDLGEVALQDVQSSAYWTGIEELAVTAQFVKLEVKIGAPFSFLNEIEVYGEEAAAPAPELPGFPENITIWGSGADIDVMTDGYNGLGEITGYENNNDKLYGISNGILDATEYSFVVELGVDEPAFDTITLYALDYAAGGVMLPEAVTFYVNNVAYEAIITPNERGIATIVAELYEKVTATEIVVLVSMGASPYDFAIFNMYTEIEVSAFVPADPVDVELVEGDNAITVPAGSFAHATTEFDKDYVLIINGQWDVTVLVNGVEYWPNRMGKLEAPLPAGVNEVSFKNGSEEDVDIVATIELPTIGDTMDDPIIIEDLGDFTAEINEKYPDGVYYTFVATEDGTLVIKINSESGWTYVVNNITAGKYGDKHWFDDEEVVAFEAIEVTAGDEIQIIINTYDPDNMFAAPAGTVDFSVAYDNGGEDTVEIALGDANMDGVIDQYDYIIARRAYFDTIELTEAQTELVDVNNDGVIDQYDYLFIARHYFGTYVIEGVVEVPVDALPAE